MTNHTDSTPDAIQGQMQGHIDGLRHLLDQVRDMQNMGSDLGNEARIENARIAIDDVESCVMDIVP